MNALAAVLAISLVSQAMAPASAAPGGLARDVAAHDDFLALVQIKGGQEIGEIEKGLGTLTPAETARVEAIGKAKLAEGSDRVIDKLAVVYAQRFTPAQLEAMAAFLKTEAGQAYSQRLITVLPALGEGMKGFDFKREVLKETCAQIKKGC